MKLVSLFYQGELFWERKGHVDGVGESCRRESVSRRANRNRQSQVNRNLDGARIYLVERIAILRFCDDSWHLGYPRYWITLLGLVCDPDTARHLVFETLAMYYLCSMKQC